MVDAITKALVRERHIIYRELEKLTNGERLWIRRTKAGYDTKTMAEIFGVDEKTYSLWEIDQGENPYKVKGLRTNRSLLNHDICRLYRRRSGRSVASVAKEMGVTKNELLAMEAGEADVDPLLEFWEC